MDYSTIAQDACVLQEVLFLFCLNEATAALCVCTILHGVCSANLCAPERCLSEHVLFSQELGNRRCSLMTDCVLGL